MDLLALGKRKVEVDGFGLREVKRVRGRDIDLNVKRVAEMVLILASIGKIRGGKVPSEVEKELMAEVRENLTQVCQDFAPKDVFPRDVFGGVIEDLGLGKFKEQMLGFKGPKMSIADKLLLSKRKFQMERSEDLALPPPPSALQRLQGATLLENRGPSLPVRVTTQDKIGQPHIPSARWEPSALNPVAAANSTPPPLPYQRPTSEVRASVPNFEPSGHPLKVSSSSASARVDPPSFRVDARTNGSSNAQASQVQSQVAYSTWNQTMGRTPGFPIQPQSFSSTQRGSDNRVSMHTVQVAGAAAIKSGIVTQPTTSKPLTTHVTAGNQPTLQQSVQSKNSVQAPHTRNSHAEVANIVQKFLKQHMERPLWTPPCRDYVNKALTCQMCQSTVTNVDSILVCDNCEKGYHVKCFHTANNHKGAIKGEWHCLRCLGANHGKPLPPKYGRVMRNQKSLDPSPDKYGSYPDKSSNAAHLVPSQQPADEKRLVTLVPRPLSNSNIALSVENHSQPLGGQSKDLGLERSGEFPSGKEHCGRVASQSDLQKECKRDDLGVIRVNHAEVATSTSMIAEPVHSLSGHSSVFDWVGNISEVVDDKIYYQSCRINGVDYKVHDHACILFDNGRLNPSKLQAMWEDRVRGSKWVTVNRCYFPSDLPEAVGRPCGLESSEVYESACGSAVDASLIQGPCDVLPSNKFEAEKGRRACSGMEGDYTSRLCYVCKWIYDETEGLFHDVSCSCSSYVVFPLSVQAGVSDLCPLFFSSSVHLETLQSVDFASGAPLTTFVGRTSTTSLSFILITFNYKGKGENWWKFISIVQNITNKFNHDR
ncbi:hypothetical protein Leryth_026891 [Lithospermum erythrorhizon]|nr:hypothetical protein Leryth_026891 [Lithospermum erythrorhizon]